MSDKSGMKWVKASERLLIDAKAQLSSLRCSYKPTQIGYVETTAVIERIEKFLKEHLDESHPQPSAVQIQFMERCGNDVGDYLKESQPEAQPEPIKVEAVEFAEWIWQKGYKYSSKVSGYPWENKKGFSTSEDLYNEFLQTQNKENC